jgi:hypothetical protein
MDALSRQMAAPIRHLADALSIAAPLEEEFR